MPKLILVCVLFLFVAFTGCGDDGASPSENGKNNGGSHEFAITSVNRDTVMWEDTVIVTMKNADTNGFTLFVHTMPVEVDSSWRNADGTAGIVFRVPTNASSGQVRIFGRGTTQAKEHHSLVVIARHRSTVRPRAESFAPTRAYTGDLLVIRGTDIHFAKTITVSIEDVVVPIVAIDSSAIYVRVSPEVQTGDLKVQLSDTTCRLFTFTKLEHQGTLQLNGSNRNVLFVSTGLLGMTRGMTFFEQDTSTMAIVGVLDFDLSATFQSIVFTRSGDSIIGAAVNDVSGAKVRFTLRLKEETESRVSGTIFFSWESANETRWVEMEVRNMRWMFDNGSYTFYTRSLDVTSQVVRYSNHFGNFRSQMETLSYEGGDPEAVVVFEIR